MVCFYGTTLDLLEKGLSSNEKKEYPAWSWLIFRLTDYIYHLDPERGGTAPRIPAPLEETVYSDWFAKVTNQLTKTFDDAAPKIVFRCLENTPAEEVALIVFEATDINILHNFRNKLQ